MNDYRQFNGSALERLCNGSIDVVFELLDFMTSDIKNEVLSITKGGVRGALVTAGSSNAYKQVRESVMGE